MPRTDEGTVKDILLDEYGPRLDGSSPSLVPFIRGANLIVNRVSTCASNKGIPLSSDELTEIETWLSAHLFKMSDQAAQSESTGDASITYQGKTDMNLDASKYGQTAQMLDPSGCLTAISKQARAGGMWLGKTPSEQIPYNRRY